MSEGTYVTVGLCCGCEKGALF